RLEPPPSCRSVADALYKSDPNKTLQIRRLPLSNWRRKPLAYHPPLPQSASCVSPRFRQRHKLLNLLQVLDMAPIVFVGLRFLINTRRVDSPVCIDDVIPPEEACHDHR